MSDIEISPEDLAQCQNIAAKAATEAAARAMADAISQVKAKVAAQRAEEEARRVEEEAKAARRAEEEAEAARRAEEEAEARRVAEEEAAARAKAEAEAEAEAASHFSEPDFPMAPPESFVPHFSTLDVSTAPPSPTPEDEEDELLEENDLPRYDLSAVAAGKRKVVPRPIMTFAPASKRRKFFGGVEIPVPLDKITPLPEPTTPSVVASDPEPSSISGYHLRDHSTTSAPASTSQPTRSTQVVARTPAKAASKSSKAPKASKSTGTKAAKRTLEEMPQLTSDEPINVKLLQNNLQELLKHFGSRVCINCITHGRECVFRGFGVKCGACSQVSASHCSFSIPSPNTEFALSIAHCAGDSSLFGLNEACRALDLSRTCAYRALLAAELEQVEYAQNCIAVVRRLQDIAFLHSPEHLHLVEGLDPDFTRDSLANLKEMADELTPWLPKPDAISALETALERAFALHTSNLRATSTVDIVEFPNAKETVAIKDFAKFLKPRNLGKLGGVFGNRQLYSLSLEDYSGGSPGPSGSSSVRATRGGNTEHEVDLGRED
ncbi:hypothetical protein BDQ17DRAFT_1434987 [Cyathus striatus]|nr:hypothetical protein BDQ17DRAFT_1434987 [Cyathus striatus]